MTELQQKLTKWIEIDPESFKSWRDHRGEQSAIVAPPRTYGVYFGVRNRRVSDFPIAHPLAQQSSRNDGDLGRNWLPKERICAIAH